MDKFEELRELNPEALLADGFEAAYIGWATIWQHPPIAVYSRDKCIQILMSRDDMDEDEAEEFFSFNVEGAYMGEFTPAFLSFNTIETTKETDG